ncbi:MAG: DNA mismatch repair endonuclease MutL [Eubacterium sp.]|nr:DNA mismatch repair endonuclease MutL [Eubacterium sp.]MCM1304289.1 DNA mismatch repair endonuclease MutL [Butyrivibrio sp.]MCM1344916.1 DNA mismatch repair endonuclease MutL [Muribaculaceae bacterium]MCM1409641.1 DNA mismatch repair endonuclease MutL [Lachnospiraceae bacterium]
MAQIHVLDSETIDKIAAGEVVERPSSVVKELVENAIDAGASAVTVEIKDGGIELIRVTDNGAGMERGQLRTAFLRHATSKITDASDLTRISSLGFRGEALSSIAAVAKVEVITKTADSVSGSRILLEGARETGFEEVGAPEGTTFLVRNLFFNTPVRRKFLKQPATEGGYIVDLMEHLALSKPDISFKLLVGSQMKFHTSGNGDLKEVIYRIYGRDVAASLVPVQMEKDGIHVEGYLGKPVLVRSNRNFEIYFINGRFIRSSVVARSVEEGYKEYLMQHKFPLCVLHITMDTDRVDVNVHPTKMDVRFSDPIAFSNHLMETVRDALRGREMIPEASLESDRELKAAGEAERKAVQAEHTPEPFERNRAESYRLEEETKYKAVAAERVQNPQMQDFMQNPVWKRVKMSEKPDERSGFTQEMTENTAKLRNPAAASLSGLPDRDGTGSSPSERRESSGSAPETDVEDFFSETSELPEDMKPTESGERNAGQPEDAELHPDRMDAENRISDRSRERILQPQDPTDLATTSQLNLFEEKILTVDNRSRFRIIGQVFETYWLIQFEEKLMMIDQHAAHEKVNYERLMKQYHEKNVVSQTLMPPVIVSLTGQEETVLKENREVFASLGFEVESFGGSEYALRSVPVDLYGCNEREMFLEVLDQLSAGTAFGNIRVIEEKIASMSCKAAVKGNNLLSFAEAEALIDELLTLENPYNCPHGRPTIVAMTKAEMDRKFKRIV